MADKLSLETLESWLWESANILRGSIDSSDFKNYIFGLLFLKRYNDVFDERVAKLMKDESLSYGDAQEEIEDKWGKFPISARWFDLISRTENIGEALDKAFATIEANNPELQHSPPISRWPGSLIASPSIAELGLIKWLPKSRKTGIVMTNVITGVCRYGLHQYPHRRRA